MSETTEPTEVVESTFVPSNTDIHGVYVTSGPGSLHDPAEASPIFETDRKFIAAEILKALDPEDPTPSSRVLFSDPKVAVTSDVEGEKAAIKELAEAALAPKEDAKAPKASKAPKS